MFIDAGLLDVGVERSVITTLNVLNIALWIRFT